jgi:hypothetical protein
MRRSIVLLSVILGLSVSVSAQIKSVYTSLAEKNCRTLKAHPKDGELYSGMCRGVSGYRLHVRKGEEHEYVSLVDTSGKEFEVSVNPASYSFLGSTAEWRVRTPPGLGLIPMALILRFQLRGPDAKSSQSILVVSKIHRSPGLKSCVVDVIYPTKSQNQDARDVADVAASKPCKSDF